MEETLGRTFGGVVCVGRGQEKHDICVEADALYILGLSGTRYRGGDGDGSRGGVSWFVREGLKREGGVCVCVGGGLGGRGQGMMNG